MVVVPTLFAGTVGALLFGGGDLGVRVKQLRVDGGDGAAERLDFIGAQRLGHGELRRLGAAELGHAEVHAVDIQAEGDWLRAIRVDRQVEGQGCLGAFNGGGLELDACRRVIGLDILVIGKVVDQTLHIHRAGQLRLTLRGKTGEAVAAGQQEGVAGDRHGVGVLDLLAVNEHVGDGGDRCLGVGVLDQRVHEGHVRGDAETDHIGLAVLDLPLLGEHVLQLLAGEGDHAVIVAERQHAVRLLDGDLLVAVKIEVVGAQTARIDEADGGLLAHGRLLGGFECGIGVQRAELGFGAPVALGEIR